jgi:heme-degrading monooxygenase HmoA
MTFAPEKIDTFQEIFNHSKSYILAMPGCLHLELWQDLHHANVFVTHSHWESEEALDAYRNSDLFISVWSKTKILFSAKPLAFSVKKV